MASAAAVATDIARSPLPNNTSNDELGTVGTIESNQPDADDPDDEDIAPTIRRKTAPTANGLQGESDLDGADKDLFGSDSDDGDAGKAPLLDDEDLASGDDGNRSDRLLDGDDATMEDQPQEELTFMDVQLGRHPVPEPTDGELYLLKVPRFLGVEPHAFKPQTFQPPTTDHHSRGVPSATFSAYNTALSTVRWRRSPSKPSKLQSNARVLRWSDGSLTLQMASDPSVQYLLPGNSLAPPQRNPPKPTPTSGKLNARRGKGAPGPAYSSEQDSFTYLVAPNIGAQVLRVTNKLTTALKVQTTSATSDEALERLQSSLAAAVRGNSANGGGSTFITLTEDPEAAKRKAELAEKEMVRAQRRREQQEARDRDRLAGRGGRRAGGGGIVLGGIDEEDELGMGVGGARSRAGAAASRKPKQRHGRSGEIYSDDEEEYGRRGRTKEDEYDEEDDFVAKSDEEEEVVESEGDEDDGIVNEAKHREPAAAGRSSPKRARQDEDAEDEDAEGEPDDETLAPGGGGSPVARTKRRRVIDEDDDE